MNVVKFDTDDAIFWQEIREAYECCAFDPATNVIIERSNKKAVINSVDDFVSIVISPCNTTTHEPLIMP